MDDNAAPREAPDFYAVLVHHLLACSAQAVVGVGAQGQILFGSPTLPSITGYSTEEWVGRNALDFFQFPGLVTADQLEGLLKQWSARGSATLLALRGQQGESFWVDVVVRDLREVPPLHAFLLLVRRSSDASAEERKLAQARWEGREQEKAFLASELHDNISQIITATKLMIGMARQGRYQQESLELCLANMDLVAAELKRLTYGRQSYHLQERGLFGAVQALLATINRAGAVHFALELEEQALALLSTDQQLHVYRILQEGANNIVRHAAASRARMRITRRGDGLTILIADNGKGFPEGGCGAGIGLYSIAGRVRALGGRLRVRTRVGRGTVLHIEIPV